jgi:deazaflavin-dependent oxidoreductase (nitroreductase family)
MASEKEMNTQKAGETMLSNTDKVAGSRSPSKPSKGMNAIVLKFAGRSRAFSALTHFGRKSGRAYTTPVAAYPLGDGFVIALAYGDSTTVDWCRNVLNTGRCLLKTVGKEYALEQPEVLQASQALKAFPPLYRIMFRSRGIREFLWVHQKRG